MSHSVALFLLTTSLQQANACSTAPAQITQREAKKTAHIFLLLSLSLSLLSSCLLVHGLFHSSTREQKFLSIHLSRRRCIIVAVRSVQKIRETGADDCRRAPEGQERLNLQVYRTNFIEYINRSEEVAARFLN